MSFAPQSRKRWVTKPCAMSLEADLKRGSLERGRFLYFPVVPGRVGCAVALRKLLLESKPRFVAVELPAFLADHYRRAIARLPEISAIFYTEGSREGDEDRGVYVPIEPADAFTEAL